MSSLLRVKLTFDSGFEPKTLKKKKKAYIILCKG